MLQAQRSASTDFERRVLADAKITRAEYEEAVQRLVTCMRDRGFDTSSELQFGFYIYRTIEEDDPSTPALEGPDSGEAMGACTFGNTRLVEALYVEMTRNPTHIEYDALILQCLQRKSMVSKTMTLTEYRAARDAGWDKVGVDYEDLRFSACEANPQLP